MNQKLYFITFGDNKNFKTAKNHLISLVKYSKIFDSVSSFSSADLENDFLAKYKNILMSERGSGYWMWKINIIEQTLKVMNENDILLYMDAGSSFNFHAKKKFLEYVNLLNNQPEIGNFRFECEKHHIEKEWTSKELFSYFDINVDSKIGNSTQFEGGHLLFKKNPHTKDLIKNFYNTVDYDPNFITDYYNTTSQISSFKECRHDQSIFSLLSKKMGSISVANETDFRNRIDMQYDYPLLATRRKGHGLKDRLRHTLFPHYYKKRPAYFY